MTTLTVIAFDPGGTTGWAMYQAEVMSITEELRDPFTDKVVGTVTSDPEFYNEKWNCGQLGPGDHADELVTLLELNHTTQYTVVVERFIPRPEKIGAKLEEAPRYITIIERWIHERNKVEVDDYQVNLVNLVWQMPAQAKGFVKDANIKKLGLWFPGQRHAMDATRHLLHYMVTNYIKRDELLEKGWKF